MIVFLETPDADKPLHLNDIPFMNNELLAFQHYFGLFGFAQVKTAYMSSEAQAKRTANQ